MAGGRPTKFSDEILMISQEYLRDCIDANTTPFTEDLALRLNVNDDTIVEWSNKHEEFSATMKRLRTLQKLHLKRDALERRIQPNMAIFLLKANHGMNEKEPDVQKEPMEIVIRYAKSADEVISEIDKSMTKT